MIICDMLEISEKNMLYYTDTVNGQSKNILNSNRKCMQQTQAHLILQ